MAPLILAALQDNTFYVHYFIPKTPEHFRLHGKALTPDRFSHQGFLGRYGHSRGNGMKMSSFSFPSRRPQLPELRAACE
jgi:hypothetical protein